MSWVVMPSTSFQADSTRVTGRLYRAWRDRTRAAYITVLGNVQEESSPSNSVAGTNGDFATVYTYKVRLMPSHVGPDGTRLVLFSALSQTGDSNNQADYRLQEGTDSNVSQTVTLNGNTSSQVQLMIDWTPSTPPSDQNGDILSVNFQIYARNGSGTKVMNFYSLEGIPGSGGGLGAAVGHYIQALPI